MLSGECPVIEQISGIVQPDSARAVTEVSRKSLNQSLVMAASSTAVTYRSGVDAPKRFARSRSLGAHFGLTPRTHASGESERSGRISKCGDRLVRTSLYEAANTLLTRLKKECALKDWGLRVAKRAGLFKARVAVARRLAVILHRMWLDGSDFRWGAVEEGTA